MFDTRTRLFSFACLKDAAGAALKSAAPASKKIGSGSGAARKVAAPAALAPSSATLIKMIKHVLISKTKHMKCYYYRKESYQYRLQRRR